MPRKLSFIIGLMLLFFLYHLPEFFDAFWIMATCKIGFLLAAYAIARAQGWKGLGGFGLGLRQRWLSQLLTGLLLGLLFFSLSVFLSILAGFDHFEGRAAMGELLQQLPLLLLMTAIPSVDEDILTRGYLFAHLRSLRPFYWIVLSAAFYVLNHIWRLNDGPAVLTYLFLLGLVLATAVWITQSLWLAFGIHWGANIAFECSNRFITLKPLVNHDGSTWLLAAVWALLWVLLLLYRNPFRIRPVV